MSNGQSKQKTYPYAPFLYETYKWPGYAAARSWGTTIDYGYETQFVAIRRNILSLWKDDSRRICMDRVQKWSKQLQFEIDHTTQSVDDLKNNRLLKALTLVQTTLYVLEYAHAIPLKDPLYSAAIAVQNRPDAKVGGFLGQRGRLTWRVDQKPPAILMIPAMRANLAA